ncbi:NIPSNAP family protein [Paenibacillus sp. FSL R5-0407]|uniref:NIPSNAP family protein n=1 Tax=Paenibacillus sp. FSL R5-0407 TaxID=2975320 RepID=UPI0030FB4D48
MFYRRKYYIVKNEFVEIFNSHFNEINLPNQTKHGARLVGRWMSQHDESTTEIFAIWEYDSYETYRAIETKVRGDMEHVSKIEQWYEKFGGRENVFKEYILDVKNDQIFSTLSNENNQNESDHQDVQFWLKTEK